MAVALHHPGANAQKITIGLQNRESLDIAMKRLCQTFCPRPYTMERSGEACLQNMFPRRLPVDLKEFVETQYVPIFTCEPKWPTLPTVDDTSLLRVGTTRPGPIVTNLVNTGPRNLYIGEVVYLAPPMDLPALHNRVHFPGCPIYFTPLTVPASFWKDLLAGGASFGSTRSTVFGGLNEPNEYWTWAKEYHSSGVGPTYGPRRPDPADAADWGKNQRKAESYWEIGNYHQDERVPLRKTTDDQMWLTQIRDVLAAGVGTAGIVALGAENTRWWETHGAVPRPGSMALDVMESKRIGQVQMSMTNYEENQTPVILPGFEFHVMLAY